MNICVMCNDKLSTVIKSPNNFVLPLLQELRSHNNTSPLDSGGSTAESYTSESTGLSVDEDSSHGSSSYGSHNDSIVNMPRGSEAGLSGKRRLFVILPGHQQHLLLLELAHMAKREHAHYSNECRHPTNDAVKCSS